MEECDVMAYIDYLCFCIDNPRKTEESEVDN